jgi:hypothetical protein
MKKCGDCGVEYPDDATQCVTCHTSLVAPGSSAEQKSYTEERESFERTTLGEFTILFIRLQAVWLLFDAVVEITYLPPYFTRLNEIFGNFQNLRITFLMVILRIVLHVAAALGVIQYADRIAVWLLDHPPSKPLKQL